MLQLQGSALMTRHSRRRTSQVVLQVAKNATPSASFSTPAEVPAVDVLMYKRAEWARIVLAESGCSSGSLMCPDLERDGHSWFFSNAMQAVGGSQKLSNGWHDLV